MSDLRRQTSDLRSQTSAETPGTRPATYRLAAWAPAMAPKVTAGPMVPPGPQ